MVSDHFSTSRQGTDTIGHFRMSPVHSLSYNTVLWSFGMLYIKSNNSKDVRFSCGKRTWRTAPGYHTNMCQYLPSADYWDASYIPFHFMGCPTSLSQACKELRNTTRRAICEINVGRRVHHINVVYSFLKPPPEPVNIPDVSGVR